MRENSKVDTAQTLYLSGLEGCLELLLDVHGVTGSSPVPRTRKTPDFFGNWVFSNFLSKVLPDSFCYLAVICGKLRENDDAVWDLCEVIFKKFL